MIKIRSHNRYSGCEEAIALWGDSNYRNAIAHLEHIELKEAIALGIFKTGMRSHLGYEDAIALWGDSNYGNAISLCLFRFYERLGDRIFWFVV